MREIQAVTEGVVLHIRKGLGNQRSKEFKDYVTNLLEAKKGGVDLSSIQPPMMTDQAVIKVEAGFVVESKTGVEGGISIKIFNAGGSYSKRVNETLHLSVELHMVSPGAPDFAAIETMSVDELTSLLKVFENDAPGT